MDAYCFNRDCSHRSHLLYGLSGPATWKVGLHPILAGEFRSREYRIPITDELYDDDEGWRRYYANLCYEILYGDGSTPEPLGILRYSDSDSDANSDASNPATLRILRNGDYWSAYYSPDRASATSTSARHAASVRVRAACGAMAKHRGAISLGLVLGIAYYLVRVGRRGRGCKSN